MTTIALSPEILSALPEIKLGCIACKIAVADSSPELLALIDARCKTMAAEMTVEHIHQNPAIADTRNAYKVLGKEPSRYRPSAEALMRRVLQGKGLYQVSNVVDLLNLVSIRHGFSIGGWDAERIDGPMTLGIGRADEPYTSIGRGDLNIEYFPVFRDAQGAFGTPTSDSERTMVRPETRHFLMVFYALGGMKGLADAMQDAQQLLASFAHATEISTQIIPH
jgi:DNA/RNA-binding domain of Phe-tRNA-synthetase-like protein